MSNRAHVAVAVALALSAAGCVSAGGTQASLLEQLPPDYRQQILAALRQDGLQPIDLRFAEISPLGPGFFGVMNGGTHNVVCVRVPARDYLHGLNGREFFTYEFSGGSISNRFGNFPMACADRPYERFTEAEKLAAEK